MANFVETLFTVCAILVAGQTVANATDGESKSETNANSRGYGMTRLGRGLQMLRLGKRSVNQDSLTSDVHDLSLRKVRSASNQNKGQLSSSDIQAALESIFDAPRDDTRRQPPLPRYGRNGNNNARFLVDTISDDSETFPSEFLPLSMPRIFLRPAPRGGRYKKSLPVGRIAFEDYIFQGDSSQTASSFKLPKFGHFMQPITNLQTKAVPRPRIGRYLDDQLNDISQSQLS